MLWIDNFCCYFRRAIEATSQPGEDAFEENFEGREGNRYGTGLSAHIQMLGKHLEVSKSQMHENIFRVIRLIEIAAYEELPS